MTRTPPPGRGDVAAASWAGVVAALAEPGGKLAEVVAGADGPVLCLRRRDTDGPHLRTPLHGMITASTGRPWRIVSARPGSLQVSRTGETVVVTADAGPVSACLELAFTCDGLLAVTTAWRNRTEHEITDVAAGLLLPLPCADPHLTMPGVLYNGNPSSDPSRPVPRVSEGGFVCEEHRLPVPAVNAAWDDRYVSLFAHPAPPYGSLGVVRSPSGLTVAAMTGVIMFDGEPDVCYVSKAEVANRPVGYRDLAPGETIITRHTLDWGQVEPRGHGFRTLVRTAPKLYHDPGAHPLSREAIIWLKTNAMDARWTGDGYLAYQGTRHGRPRSYLYGWTGQCLKLALCDALLGRAERARRAAGFYVEGSRTPTPGLRHGRYLLDDDSWQPFRKDGADFVSSRAHGETIADLAGIALRFRDAGLPVPPAWEEAVEDAAALFWRTRLPEGVVPLGWAPDGTPFSPLVTAAGIACVQAMLGAYRLSGERVWLRRAEEVLARYHRLHAATFERPFAHATLDASGEDKEAGMYFFLGAFELFRLTGRELYAGWAEVAADWLLTFVYTWSPKFDQGSTFGRRGFKARGWPAVSVQNHHLDVFFPTSELAEFGSMTGRARYVREAETILHAMGQGICREPGDWGFETPGEQGEGFFQTNWQRTGEANTWNPSWVIALPLYHALRMRRVS